MHTMVFEIDSETDLSKVIPIETWEQVFDKIGDDPEQLAKLLDTCAEFRGILITKRCYFLFPLVLPHIYKYMNIVPNTVTRADLLNLRLVCSKWKIGVDSFIRLNYTKGFLFEEPEQIADFLNKYPKTENYNARANPFTLSSIVGFSMETDSPEIFWFLLTELCESFGWGIHNLILRFSYATDQSSLYLHARQILSHTANLDNLVLQQVSVIRSGEQQQLDPKTQVRQLSGVIRDYSFPELKKLKHLSTFRISNRIVKEILAKCPNLIRIDKNSFEVERGLVGDQFYVLTHDTQSLTKLEVLKSNEYCRFQGDMMEWSSLKCLDMDMMYSQWDEMVEGVNKFKTSLRTLVLRVHGRLSRESNRKLSPLELDNLLELSLTFNVPPYPNMDFILGLKSLRSLDVRKFGKGRGGTEVENNGVVQIWGFGGEKVYESNVWKMLPSLRCVSIVPSRGDEVVSTWEGYEAYQCSIRVRDYRYRGLINKRVRRFCCVS